MRELILNIERVRRINETHQHIHLSTDASLMQMKAGQSLLANALDSHGDDAGSGGRLDPYLREQWFPVVIGKNEIVVERPMERRYEPSTQVSVLGIIGQPFRYRRTLRSVLLLAVDTAPSSLLLAIPALLANYVSVTLVLLGSAAGYKTAHLAPEVEVILGDGNLNWANRVTTVGWADQVFVAVDPSDESACFSRVLELFRTLRADLPTNYLFGVFQPPLPCGVGACSACMIRLKSVTALACEDGPAFDLLDLNFR